MSKKEYINGISCKAISGKFGEFFNISIKLEEIEKYVNEKGYVNMTMSRRKEKGRWGETHYFILNNYKKDSQTGQTNNKKFGDDELSIEDIPF